MTTRFAVATLAMLSASVSFAADRIEKYFELVVDQNPSAQCPERAKITAEITPFYSYRTMQIQTATRRAGMVEFVSVSNLEGEVEIQDSSVCEIESSGFETKPGEYMIMRKRLEWATGEESKWVSLLTESQLILKWETDLARETYTCHYAPAR